MPKFFKLKRNNDTYNIFNKKPFEDAYKIDADNVSKSFDFAYQASFGQDEKEVVDEKSDQKNGEIFVKAFQGKLSEYAFKELASTYSLEVSEPDLDASNHKICSSYDALVSDKKMALLSTKYYGNLLLLETKDWNNEGEYIHNNATETSSYDYILLIRLKPSVDNIIRKKSFLVSNDVDQTELRNMIIDENWEYDFLGYITTEDLKYIIKEKFILPQNSLLNGKTKMDTENYYVQGNNMWSVESLLKGL